ncbi:hypothetical protein MGEO_20560 [Marivita geojedonensis]|uniref:Uncharacterized protein n=1 Tax=Marivita geojedonensis TaxID=1123756 RepID=A0A1X4N856_9RHOB|nr:hypothetical protein MGEO_20560 [Marivita geojedonensis]
MHQRAEVDDMQKRMPKFFFQSTKHAKPMCDRLATVLWQQSGLRSQHNRSTTIKFAGKTVECTIANEFACEISVYLNLGAFGSWLKNMRNEALKGYA